MKRFLILGIALLAVFFAVPALSAQSLKGMSLNGSTGLYSIPSGRIGWERSSDFGLDFGYHAIINDGRATHIPKMGVSLFKWVELTTAFDIQPENHYYDYNYARENSTDFIGGLKIQFPLQNTALALGGNFQSLNLGSGNRNYNSGQIYVAATYAGRFFNMPAETTVVLGKTFGEDQPNWNIDFGMGFDLLVLPDVLHNFVHWIVDFANFSYSVEAFSASAQTRGVFNTGLRVDLSAIPALNKFKFVIDIAMTDAFDQDRAFSTGVVFGIPVL